MLPGFRSMKLAEFAAADESRPSLCPFRAKGVCKDSTTLMYLVTQLWVGWMSLVGEQSLYQFFENLCVRVS